MNNAPSTTAVVQLVGDPEELLDSFQEVADKATESGGKISDTFSEVGDKITEAMAGMSTKVDSSFADTDAAGTAAADSLAEKWATIADSIAASMAAAAAKIDVSMATAGASADKAATKADAGGKWSSVEGAGASDASKATDPIKKVGQGVGLGVVAVAAASVYLASKYNATITLLETGAGELHKNLAMVSAGILAMAPKVGETATELSSGMYYIESAGYHGAKGLKVLQAAAEGAKVGNASLADVSSVLTTAMHDYNIPAKDATEVTSALVETVASGKTTMPELASAMGKVLPVASALHISFQQVAGAMATQTNAGVSARLAATHLSNTLLALAAPSKVATTAMASVGLTSQQVKNEMSEHGLGSALEMMEAHLGSKFPKGSVQYVTAMKAMLGGTTGYQTALMLTGKNQAEFTSTTASIGGVLNKTSSQVQGFSEVQKDSQFQMEQLQATVETLGIKLGNVLIPLLEKLATYLEKVVTWLEKHKDVAIALAGVIAGVLVAALAAWVAGMIAAAAPAIALAAACALILAPIILLGVGIYELVKHWRTVWGFIKEITRDAWEWIKQHLSIVVPVIITLITGPIGLLVYEIVRHWKTIEKDAEDAWNWIKQAAKTIWGDIVSVVKGIVGNVVGALSSVWHTVESDAEAVWGDIKAFIKKVPGDIEGFFLRFTLIGILISHWHTIEADAKSIWNGLIAWFKTVPNTIINGFDVMVADFETLGEHLVEALLRGMDGLGADMEGLFKDAVKTMLPSGGALGWIEKHLGLGGVIKWANSPTGAAGSSSDADTRGLKASLDKNTAALERHALAGSVTHQYNLPNAKIMANNPAQLESQLAARTKRKNMTRS